MNSKNDSFVTPVFSVGVTSSAIVAAIASVLYGVAYHTSYDTVLRHFESDAVLPTVFGVLLFLSAVIFSVSALLMRKKFTFVRHTVTAGESFALWFVFLMFLIFGLVSVSGGDVRYVSKLGEFCTKASAPLAILSCIPFFCSASEKLRHSAVHRISSFVPILWGICLLFKYYFDLKEMPLNDPELTLTMVSISAALIFFLSECRSVLGMNTPAIAVFSSSAALTMTGAVSAARLVLWRLDGHTIPSPTETFILFAVAVLAGCRLYGMRYSIVSAGASADVQSESYEPDGNSL